MTSKRPAALTGSYVLLGVLVVLALLGPSLAPRLFADATTGARFLAGARGTVVAATLVMAFATGIGLLTGALAALGSPFVDTLLSRAVEIAGALPSLIVVVVLRAAAPALGLVAIGAVLAVLRTLGNAKTVRASVLDLSREDFALAARALGSGRFRLFRTHVLPHVVGPVLSNAAFTAAAVVALDAALSFCGLGGHGDTWGALLADAAHARSAGGVIVPTLGVLAIVAPLQVIAEHLSARVSAGRRFV